QYIYTFSLLTGVHAQATWRPFRGIPLTYIREHGAWSTAALQKGCVWYTFTLHTFEFYVHLLYQQASLREECPAVLTAVVVFMYYTGFRGVFLSSELSAFKKIRKILCHVLCRRSPISAARAEINGSDSSIDCD
ncbi:unnamed protein product, partial [Pylaiella littoralis]